MVFAPTSLDSCMASFVEEYKARRIFSKMGRNMLAVGFNVIKNFKLLSEMVVIKLQKSFLFSGRALCCIFKSG